MRSGPAPDEKDVTKRRAGKTKQARRLRQHETEEEYRLWGELRNRRLNGHKFARQIPLGPYVVDFLCREERLIVEIDGFQHADNPSDVARTQWLTDSGYSVLRFWNREITRERKAVLETILAVLENRRFQRDDILRSSARRTRQNDEREPRRPLIRPFGPLSPRWGEEEFGDYSPLQNVHE